MHIYLILKVEDLCEWVFVLEKIDDIFAKHGIVIRRFELIEVPESDEEEARQMICSSLQFLSTLFRSAKNKCYFISFEVYFNISPSRTWLGFFLLVIEPSLNGTSK